MELDAFHREILARVKDEHENRLNDPEAGYPYPELILAEIVMQHMAEVGMTSEPVVCHYEGTFGNAILRLSGFAVYEEADQVNLDMFICLYSGSEELSEIPVSEAKNAVEQCWRFLKRCAEGRLTKTVDPSSEAYQLIMNIQDSFTTFGQIRIYVITDRRSKSKFFQPREHEGKTIKLEIMDIERLYRHWSEGKPRDEIVVNFEEVTGTPLPCIYVPGEMSEYDYALTVFPGETLRFVYERYGARLLEDNVRSFLSTSGKVNKGIRDTIRDNPDHFMAYNNGIVIIADEVRLGKTPDGSNGIKYIRGMQVVNGGQTTASIYFTKKKNPSVDLRRLRVAAKIIILNSADPAVEETFVSAISRYANSQNVVRQADLSANKPFHVEIEKLANTVYCPDGAGRWFYERAAGSYNVMLAREGATPARLKHLKLAVPSSRKITKTDLAKFINAWNQKPHIVSLGAQKNFSELMRGMENDDDNPPEMPDVTFYKQLVAKAILFKSVQKLVRPLFPAFQANVTAYLIAIIANRFGNNFDLDRIWQQQGASAELLNLLKEWAQEVNRILHASSGGRMVSEWAKKAECWENVLAGSYPKPVFKIQEMKSEV
ncbi:MAG: AIPR family protein [Desulfatirhabdiaceae bacterium]